MDMNYYAHMKLEDLEVLAAIQTTRIERLEQALRDGEYLFKHFCENPVDDPAAVEWLKRVKDLMVR